LRGHVKVTNASIEKKVRVRDKKASQVQGPKKKGRENKKWVGRP